MRHLFLSFIIAAILLGVGVYHGLATDRWSDAATDDSAGRQLADMPTTFGDWIGERLARDVDDDPKTFVLDCRFTNRKTGKWVLTAISAGRPGRVAIHNPEHCYLGNGYKVVDGVKTVSLAENKQPAMTFWTGHFEKKRPTGLESIRIYWGWSSDGAWQSPEYPRLYFATTPRLHKLYLIHPVTGHDTPDDLAANKEFMTQYVTELSRRIAH